MQWMLFFIGLLATCGLHAEVRHHDDTALAHPVFVSQDSRALMIFLSSSNGVIGHYCFDCNSSTHDDELILDRFGNASIESVFYGAYLGSGAEQLYVLYKLDDKHQVRAYQFVSHTGRYSRINRLQPYLDQITLKTKKPNASKVKAELRKLVPFEFDVEYDRSGIDEFDSIDHLKGDLIGYYDVGGKRLDSSYNHDAFAYKKSFGTRTGVALTATYLRNDESGSYRVERIGWEKDPSVYSGTEHGHFITYLHNQLGAMLGSRGVYANGSKEGSWEEFDINNKHSGNYKLGLRDGQWLYESYGDGGSGFDTYLNGVLEGPSERHSAGELVSKGQYASGEKSGQWLYGAYDDGGSGFDTYLNGILEGPSERHSAGELISKGQYVSGEKSGQWITEDGSGIVRHEMYVGGKLHGVSREINEKSGLTTEEYYENGQLHGQRLVRNKSGAVVYSGNYQNGQLHGREVIHYDDGKTLRSDISWINGKKHGKYKTYYRSGQPKYLIDYEEGEGSGHYKLWDENGTLVEDRNFCRWKKNIMEPNNLPRCGRQRLYSAGKLIDDHVYLFGTEQHGVSYRNDGTKIEETVIDSDEVVTRNNYHSNGKLKCTMRHVGYGKRVVDGKEYKDYTKADLDGLSQCFYESGALQRKANFSKGRLEGCWYEFDEAGKQTAPGPEGCGAKRDKVRMIDFSF